MIAMKEMEQVNFTKGTAKGAWVVIGPPEEAFARPLLAAQTRVTIIIGPSSEQTVEFTEAEFHAELKKAGGRLDEMAASARKAHREGKTRKFPA